MRRTFLLKSMLLLCALVAGSSSVWADATPVVTADFTAKTASHQDYTDTWTYGDWSLTKCSNNNKSWAYIRCGGKGGDKTTSTTTDATIIKGTKKIAKAIGEVKVIHSGTSNNNFTVNSIVLEVSSKSDFSTIDKEIELTPSITKEVAGTVSFTDNAPYAADSYYRITINWTVKGTKNYGLDITKIEFYEPSTEPSISSNNVDVAFDASSGEISYTIANPIEGAAIDASSDNDWISGITVNESTKKVSFSTTTNEGTANRVGTITLAYKKAGETLATKAVTITQGKLDLKDPVFSPMGGVYASAQNVTITCSTSGAEIYYTTDGTDPKTNGTLYSNAITVSKPTTIKAVSKKSGIFRNIIEQTFTFELDLLSFSWDLSKDETSSASTSKLSWTGTYASMEVNKGSSTTNANNYYPGTSGKSYTSTRFYPNSTLTITPGAVYGLKSIVFESTSEDYASALQSSTWTNATAVVSGKTVTVTPTVGSTAVSATIGNTCGFTSVVVKYIPASVSITLNAACTDGSLVYGTYSNTKPFVVSGDIEVSEVQMDEGKMYFWKYNTGDVVPANTGVLVSALEGGDYSVNLSSNAGTSVLGTDNCLRPSGNGITAEEMAAADANSKFYRLTMHNGTSIGFWWGAADGAAFTIAANKAYLAVPNTSAPCFTFDGDATGINTLNVGRGTLNGECYNLAGQRIAQPTKGLYIVNGRKVIIK